MSKPTASFIPPTSHKLWFHLLDNYVKVPLGYVPETIVHLFVLK